MEVKELRRADEHVIVYGAGNYLEKRYESLCKHYLVDAIVDKNKRGKFKCVPILEVEYLNKKNVNKVVIMIENRDICVEVANTLVTQYSIPRNNIIFGVNLVDYNEKEGVFNIGIMGCGSMASQMATEILEAGQNIKICACASRNQEKADAFAYKYGIEKAYGSYVDMLKDNRIDLVYIATPVSEHFFNMKQCIEYGKNILCEKSFTINEKQARKIFALARERSLYVAEAMTIRYHSVYYKLKELLLNGKIGEVFGIQASINYKVDTLDRIKNVALGGGALLDLGVYNFNFMTLCLGYDVTNMVVQCEKYESGTDACLMLVVKYKNGKIAELHCDTRCAGKNQGIVYGEKGFIVIDEINRPSQLLVYDNERRVIEEYYPRPKEFVLVNEIVVARKSVEKNRIESEECSHLHSINIMQMMDRVRMLIDLKYPMEENVYEE